jgi:hypothetical protein
MNRAFHVLLLCLILAAFMDGTAEAAPQTFLTLHCADGTEFVATFYQARRRRGSFNAHFNARLLLRPIGSIACGPVGVLARPATGAPWGIPQFPQPP